MPECLVCGTEFDWEPQPGRVPKTCSEDCRRTRKTQQSEQSRQRAAARGCPDHLHGTSTGYSHYKCDCTKCTTWARGYKRKRREIIREETPPHWLETEQL